MPDRLTYFTSVPTTVSAHLLANWDQGAQWRAQVAGETDAEVLVSATDDEIFERAQSQRVSLIDRRERALATRLSNLDSDDQGDRLTEAMREVETLSRLIGQIMALHYGHVARLDETIRGRLWGSEGLLSRGDIRRARDQGVWMRDVPALGQQRLESLGNAWRQWPAQLRQTGTLSPELQMANVSLNAATMSVGSNAAQPEGQ